MNIKNIKNTSLVIITVLFFAAMLSSCHRETCPTYDRSHNSDAPIEQHS